MQIAFWHFHLSNPEKFTMPQKSAMDCCNTAQKNTKAACDCSAK